MTLSCYTTSAKHAVTITVVDSKGYKKWFARQALRTKKWGDTHDFRAASGEGFLMQGSQGELKQVILGAGDWEDFWFVGNLAKTLPPLHYCFDYDVPSERIFDLALTWGLGAYQFTRYKKSKRKVAKLALSEDGGNLRPSVKA